VSVASCYPVFGVLYFLTFCGGLIVVLYWCTDVLLCGDVSCLRCSFIVSSVDVALYPDLLFLGMDTPNDTTDFCKN
jgi:hypothetical protein